MLTKDQILKLNEQASTRAERFAKSFERSRRNFNNIGDTGAARMIKLIRDLRGEVRERLKFAAAEDPKAPFTTRILPEITSGINQSISEFSRISKAEVTARLEDTFEAGSKVTAGNLRAAGIEVPFPQASPEVLATLSRSADDIFDETSTRLAERLNTEISKSAVGLEPASGTIRRVEKILQTAPETIRGQRRRIGFAFQAEEIVRTELGRVYSNAQQLASEQIAENTIPNLRKWWRAQGDSKVRTGHKDIMAATRPGGETGPIPIKARFRVVDHSRTGSTEFLTMGKNVRPGLSGQRVARVQLYTRRGALITDQMLFPRDPGASPGNVIKCRCVIIEVVPDLDEVFNRAIGMIESGIFFIERV